MTTPGPSARWLMMDGWNLTTTAGLLGDMTPLSHGQNVSDLTGPPSTAPVFLPAGYEDSGTFEAVIWADSSLQDYLDDLHGVTPADRNLPIDVCYGWSIATVTYGSMFEGFRGYMSEVEPMGPKADLTRFRVKVQPTGDLSVGEVLLPLSTKTADGTTEANKLDNTASSSGGAHCFLQVTALTLDGATNLACEVEDSADDITYGTLQAFTVVTAAPAAEKVSVTGTVEQYAAAKWTWTDGAGAGSTATFFIGFERL